MSVVSEVAWFVLGLAVLLVVIDSALRTFVLPRGALQPLTRSVFALLRHGFDGLARLGRTYDARDAVMALYAPVGLLVLPLVWLDLATTTLSFVEAATGLGLLALLIAYLPTIYGAFSRREVLVAQLAARSTEPPSGVTVLVRAQEMERFDLLSDLWVAWQMWFAEIEETHTSLGVLSFFRSPRAHRSWITSCGAVLDAASLRLAAVDLPFDPQAGLCVRNGFVALDAVAEHFHLPYDQDPLPTDPISIARDEFDDACARLAAAGIALRADRDQAWRDFVGWRVNYDRALLGLAGFLMVPYAPWSSDRSLRQRPSFRRTSGTARSRGSQVARPPS